MRCRPAEAMPLTQAPDIGEPMGTSQDPFNTLGSPGTYYADICNADPPRLSWHPARPGQLVCSCLSNVTHLSHDHLPIPQGNAALKSDMPGCFLTRHTLEDAGIAVSPPAGQAGAPSSAQRRSVLGKLGRAILSPFGIGRLSAGTQGAAETLIMRGWTHLAGPALAHYRSASTVYTAESWQIAEY